MPWLKPGCSLFVMGGLQEVCSRNRLVYFLVPWRRAKAIVPAIEMGNLILFTHRVYSVGTLPTINARASSEMKNNFRRSPNYSRCFEVPASEHCLQSNGLWSTRREGDLKEGGVKGEGRSTKIVARSWCKKQYEEIWNGKQQSYRCRCAAQSTNIAQRKEK